MSVLGVNVLGFAGTQKGLTAAQHATLVEVIYRCRREGFDRLAHGCEAHADTEAALIARRAGLRLIGLPGAPPGDPSRSTITNDVEFAPRKPLERDKQLARSLDTLIACPRQELAFILRRARERDVAVEDVIRRSGTWATVRYTRALHKPVLFVWPDGSAVDPWDTTLTEEILAYDV